jgi:hypothetical protein
MSQLPIEIKGKFQNSKKQNQIKHKKQIAKVKRQPFLI